MLNSMLEAQSQAPAISRCPGICLLCTMLSLAELRELALGTIGLQTLEQLKQTTLVCRGAAAMEATTGSDPPAHRACVAITWTGASSTMTLSASSGSRGHSAGLRINVRYMQQVSKSYAFLADILG